VLRRVNAQVLEQSQMKRETRRRWTKVRISLVFIWRLTVRAPFWAQVRRLRQKIRERKAQCLLRGYITKARIKRYFFMVQIYASFFWFQGNCLEKVISKFASTFMRETQRRKKAPKVFLHLLEQLKQVCGCFPCFRDPPPETTMCQESCCREFSLWSLFEGLFQGGPDSNKSPRCPKFYKGQMFQCLKKCRDQFEFVRDLEMPQHVKKHFRSVELENLAAHVIQAYEVRVLFWKTLVKETMRAVQTVFTKAEPYPDYILMMAIRAVQIPVLPDDPLIRLWAKSQGVPCSYAFPAEVLSMLEPADRARLEAHEKGPTNQQHAFVVQVPHLNNWKTQIQSQFQRQSRCAVVIPHGCTNLQVSKTRPPKEQEEAREPLHTGNEARNREKRCQRL